jgi:hypothetical protein
MSNDFDVILIISLMRRSSRWGLRSGRFAQNCITHRGGCNYLSCSSRRFRSFLATLFTGGIRSDWRGSSYSSGVVDIASRHSSDINIIRHHDLYGYKIPNKYDKRENTGVLSRFKIGKSLYRIKSIN